MYRRMIIIYILLVLIMSACSDGELDGDYPNTQTVIPATKSPTKPSATIPPVENPTFETPDQPVQATLSPTLSPTQQIKPHTPSPTDEPVFVVQSGTPLQMTNFIDTNAGCNWMGIGGQIFDVDGIPLTEFIVEVGGSLEGEEILRMGVTGDTPSMGPGGYSIKIAEQPIDTDDIFWLRVYSLDGNPSSEMINFSTYQDCDKNFILINLVALPPGYGVQAVIPLILSNSSLP